MKLIYPTSLAKTVDAVNVAFFNNTNLPKTEKATAAKWLASRQGITGSYSGMSAPTKRDFAEPIRLFTGEKLNSNAIKAHILGQESCQTIILLNVKNKSIQNSMTEATKTMSARLSPPSGSLAGFYCCGTCSCAYWRHLSVGGFDHSEQRLTAAMKTLKQHRDKNGKWRRFPFYYTLLALTEIDLPKARSEMKYAAGNCEKILKRTNRDNKFDPRRKIIAERILAKF